MEPSKIHSVLVILEANTSGTNMKNLNHYCKGNRELVDYLIAEGYLSKCGKNSVNEDLYVLSSKGKEFLK